MSNACACPVDVGNGDGGGAHSDVVQSIKLGSLDRGGVTDPCSGSHAVGRQSADCGRPNVASGSDDKDRGCGRHACDSV